MAEYLWQNLEVPQVKGEHSKNAPEILLWKENFSIFLFVVLSRIFFLSSSCTYVLHVCASSYFVVGYHPAKQIFAIIYTFFFRFAFACVCVCVLISPGKFSSHKCARASVCSISFILRYVCMCLCVFTVQRSHLLFICVNLYGVDVGLFIRYFRAFIKAVKHFRLECFIELVWFFLHIYYLIFSFFPWFTALIYLLQCTWHMTINSMYVGVYVCGFAIKLFIIRVCFDFPVAGFM